MPISGQEQLPLDAADQYFGPVLDDDDYAAAEYPMAERLLISGPVFGRVQVLDLPWVRMSMMRYCAS